MSETPAPAGSKPLPVKSAADADFLVSSAPHLSAGLTTRRIMLEVVLAMTPLFGAAIWLHGVQAITVTVVTVLGCLVAEAIGNWMRGHSQSSLTDCSAIVTGVILAFSLPPVGSGGLYLYQAFIGGFVAIALAKAVFGGLGQNLFNPAMVGRAFLMVCFPAGMAKFAIPVAAQLAGVDAVTQATPLLADAKDLADQIPALKALFIGDVGGCIGETSALAALIGGLYLVFRGIADWRQPVGMLATIAIIAQIGAWANADFEGPLFHLTSGAAMFGAFFIATDYVGAPVNPIGRFIFGVGVGALVMLIRLFGAYPEGVMFAILIMNALTPIIERWTTPTPYGGHVAAS